MKDLIYTGKVSPNAKSIRIYYRSTGEVNDNGLVTLVHVSSGEESFYTDHEYKTLFKII